jgi:hypothetical protein
MRSKTTFLILRALLLIVGMLTLQACFEEGYSGRGPGYAPAYGYGPGYGYGSENSYGPRYGYRYESPREEHEEEEHEHGERD